MNSQFELHRLSTAKSLQFAPELTDECSVTVDAVKYANFHAWMPRRCIPNNATILRLSAPSSLSTFYMRIGTASEAVKDGKKYVAWQSPQQKRRDASLLDRDLIWLSDAFIDLHGLSDAPTVSLEFVADEAVDAIDALTIVELWPVDHTAVQLAHMPCPAAMKRFLNGEVAVRNQTVTLPLLDGSMAVFRVSFKSNLGRIERQTRILIRHENFAVENAQTLFRHRNVVAAFGDAGRQLEQIMRLNMLPVGLDGNVPRRILIHGASGIGKSYLISALASAFQLKIFKLTHSLLVALSEKYHGSQARMLALALETAADYDRALKLFPKKTSDFENKARLWATPKSLSRNHLVLATSCAPDRIDGMVRHAFVQHEIEVALPTPFERYMMLRICIHDTLRHSAERGHVIEFASSDNNATKLKAPISDGPFAAVLQRIATEAHGFMASDMQGLWQQLCRTHCERDPSSMRISERDFDAALDAMKHSASLLRSAISNKSALIQPSKTDFKDIGGLDDVKQALSDAITGSLNLTHPLAPSALKPFRPSAGVLLYGPPGTGKTMLARAIATMHKVNFLPIAIPDLIKAEVGESEKSLRKYFSLARQCAPCVVFLDEIDAVFGGERGAGSGGSDTIVRRLVSQLLSELDTITRHRGQVSPALKSDLEMMGTGWMETSVVGCGAGVLVLAATNIPQSLDSALLRPGRFEKTVYVPPPDHSSRLQILKRCMERIKCHPQVAAEEYLAKVSRRTDGYSGADLANLCRMASMTAMQRVRDALTDAQRAETDKSWVEQLMVTHDDLQEALASVHPSLSPKLLRRYESFQSQSH